MSCSSCSRLTLLDHATNLRGTGAARPSAARRDYGHGARFGHAQRRAHRAGVWTCCSIGTHPPRRDFKVFFFVVFVRLTAEKKISWLELRGLPQTPLRHWYGVVVIACYLLGSDRVFSGFLPRHTTDISWRMGPGLCFLKCDTEKPDTPALRGADNSEI